MCGSCRRFSLSRTAPKAFHRLCATGSLDARSHAPGRSMFLFLRPKVSLRTARRFHLFADFVEEISNLFERYNFGSVELNRKVLFDRYDGPNVLYGIPAFN